MYAWMSYLLPVLLEPYSDPKMFQSTSGEFASVVMVRVKQYLKKMMEKSLKVLPKAYLVKFTKYL